MRTVVGVLRGGPSSEYEVSLKSGAAVLEHLNRGYYEPRDIFIDRQGRWHNRGVEMNPEKALTGVDVAFNTIHGEFGEDGNLHRILDPLGIAYTGADKMSSILAFNKQATREAVHKLGVKVAHGKVVDIGGDIEALAHELFRTFPHPAVVKPVIGGSSVGVTVVRAYGDLAPALQRAAQISPKVLIEEFIKGREATVGVIENFRNHKTYALLPVEIVPPEGNFFDYENKYNGATREICPGNFSEATKLELERVAKLVHDELGLAHYSRSDFIVSRRGIYFLEINSAAAVGLTAGSLLPKALAAVGTTLSDFLHHVIQLAKGGR
jgi:D-alanine-D-alanine ligase